MSFSPDQFFKTIDEMDAASFAQFFHPHGSFTFANETPSIGQAAVAQVATNVFQLLKGISHDRTGTWTKDNLIFNEGKCHYHRKDDQLITIPYFSIVEMEGEKIKSYRAYVDSTPLLAGL